jgi:hypothetical protein
MLTKRANEPRKRKTPRAPVWCKFCVHKHSKDVTCKLFLRECTAKSGRKVMRWCP